MPLIPVQAYSFASTLKLKELLAIFGSEARVEKDRLLVGIPKPDAADVAMDAAEEFEPTERQAVLDLAELGDAVLVEPGERIPLTARLVGAADGAALHALELLAGVVAECIQSRIETVNVVALAFDL